MQQDMHRHIPKLLTGFTGKFYKTLRKFVRISHMPVGNLTEIRTNPLSRNF